VSCHIHVRSIDKSIAFEVMVGQAFRFALQSACSLSTGSNTVFRRCLGQCFPAARQARGFICMSRNYCSYTSDHFKLYVLCDTSPFQSEE